MCRDDSEHHRAVFLRRCANAYLIKERRAGGRSSGRAEPLTSSSGLRTPNCTLLMVRSGHALSPEGGPPPCIAEAGALRRRKPQYKKPAPPPLKRSDLVRAAAG